MESKIAKAIGFRYQPVAIGFDDEKPENARQFAPGRWGCIMFMLVRAANGDRCVFDRETFGCFGGGTGLGFGNQYRNFPGGEEGFCYFLSTGNDEWEQGRQTAEAIEPHVRKEFMEDYRKGEGYMKSPEKVRRFIDSLPITDNPLPYVVFRPLSDINEATRRPEVVVFLADMDEVAALTVLANYHRGDNENVIFPYAAGCMSVGIYPFREAKADKPRAVLGMNDISARLAVKRQLKEDVMTFAIPYPLFLEMEDNVSDSFLERHSWRELMKLKGRE